MGSSPTVSVIIPTYNRGSLLPRALKSVLAQTFSDIEVLVIDDGSTDDTRQVVENFQKKDERIKYYWQENSGGASSPHNLGISKSGGSYIIFHASDDTSSPTWLEKQLNLFENGVDVVSTNVNIIDPNTGKTTEISKPSKFDREYIIKNSLTRNYVFGVNLVRREAYEKVGGFDESLKIREDFDMWIRLAQAGCAFKFVYEPLYQVYLHEGQISNRVSDANRVKIMKYLLKKHKTLYEKYPASENFRDLGTLQMLSGDTRDARRNFVKAAVVNPLNLKAYFSFSLSLLGGRTFRRIFDARKQAITYRLEEREK